MLRPWTQGYHHYIHGNLNFCPSSAIWICTGHCKRIKMRWKCVENAHGTTRVACNTLSFSIALWHTCTRWFSLTLIFFFCCFYFHVQRDGMKLVVCYKWPTILVHKSIFVICQFSIQLLNNSIYCLKKGFPL